MSGSVFGVVVPASTSNLGPGFDCLGMAVDRHLGLQWRAHGGGGLVVRGEHPPPGFGDRLAGGLGALGLPEDGTLEVDSTIPVGRGLGSSAALSVALHVLRSHLSGMAIEVAPILDAVTAEEGHPDNAAPALVGGLVAATRREGSVSVIPLPVSDRIGWAWAAPGAPSETRAMREVLPTEIDREAAIRNAARVAHLIPALAAGDGDTLRWAMEDELHVPMRLPLIPAGESARSAALEAGAWACTISGAGSGLIAATPRDRTGDVVAAMAAAFRRADPAPAAARAFELRPDLEGARWGPDVRSRPGREDAPPTRRG
jgi:homoserine kinase